MVRPIKKIMVYFHDQAGFSNMERMLSILADMLDSEPDLSILLITGSPMMQTFRIPSRLDYIKLPALNLDEGNDSLNHDPFQNLTTKKNEISRFRSSLLLATAKSFNPDLFLADKEPNGIRNELIGVLCHLKIYAPETRQVLLMGDPLDTTETCQKTWETIYGHQTIELFFDLVLLNGDPDVGDASGSGAVPSSMANKVRLCLDHHAFKKISQMILAELPPNKKERGPTFAAKVSLAPNKR